MKSEKRAVAVETETAKCFQTCRKHDVLLRKFQKLEEFLKEHFDNAIKHDALLRKVLRMMQVEKKSKKNSKFDLTMRKCVIY